MTRASCSRVTSGQHVVALLRRCCLASIEDDQSPPSARRGGPSPRSAGPLSRGYWKPRFDQFGFAAIARPAGTGRCAAPSLPYKARPLRAAARSSVPPSTKIGIGLLERIFDDQPARQGAGQAESADEEERGARTRALRMRRRFNFYQRGRLRPHPRGRKREAVIRLTRLPFNQSHVSCPRTLLGTPRL